MIKFLLALFGLCCGVSLFAAPVATGGTTPRGWYDDFAAAKRASVKTGRPILALFTGSDWCPYCVRLKQNALDKPDFKEFAEKNLVLFYADFPDRVQLPAELSARNNALAKQFGVRGFPTTVILSPDGKVLGRIGGYVTNYLQRIKRLIK